MHIIYPTVAENTHLLSLHNLVFILTESSSVTRLWNKWQCMWMCTCTHACIHTHTNTWPLTFISNTSWVNEPLLTTCTVYTTYRNSSWPYCLLLGMFTKHYALPVYLHLYRKAWLWQGKFCENLGEDIYIRTCSVNQILQIRPSGSPKDTTSPWVCIKL
jgi:hypothetical protein